MAWAHIAASSAYANAAGVSEATIAVTSAAAVTAGNVVVICVSTGTTTLTGNPTDSGSNTYTLINSVATNNCQMYYSVITTGGVLTVTATLTAASLPAISLDEYSFSAGTLTVITNQNNGTGTSINTASLAPPKAGLALGYCLPNNTAATASAQSGFVLRQSHAQSAAQFYGLFLEDAVNYPFTNFTMNMAASASGAWSAISAVIYSSADSGTVTKAGGSILLGVTDRRFLIPSATV
jgi:hypothetical protein